MEKVQGYETGLAESYTPVLETWEKLDATITAIPRKKLQPAELIAALNNHTATLPKFIESYIGEDAQVDDVIEVHRLLAGLHERRIFEYIVTHGFNAREFYITSRDRIEDYAETLQEKAYENDIPLQKQAAEGLYIRLSEALLLNIKALDRCCQEERKQRNRLKLRTPH